MYVGVPTDPPPPRGARRLTTNIYPGSLISWAIFLEFSLHQLCIFKMISVSWDHFEVCMLGYPPTPPPPPRGARRLTTNIYPGSLISWAIFWNFFYTTCVYSK